jgi:hypothetical protein
MVAELQRLITELRADIRASISAFESLQQPPLSPAMVHAPPQQPQRRDPVSRVDLAADFAHPVLPLPELEMAESHRCFPVAQHYVELGFVANRREIRQQPSPPPPVLVHAPPPSVQLSVKSARDAHDSPRLHPWLCRHRRHAWEHEEGCRHGAAQVSASVVIHGLGATICVSRSGSLQRVTPVVPPLRSITCG